MCPACMTTAVLIAKGVASAGGLAAVTLRVARARPVSPEEAGTGDPPQAARGPADDVLRDE